MIPSTLEGENSSVPKRNNVAGLPTVCMLMLKQTECYNEN